MATKREVMLAGVPAKLAHMIASDQPHLVGYTAAGTDVNSATLLETNWVLLNPSSAEGLGVRLRPASGQYLHVIRNPQDFGVYVYPDPLDQINNRGLGSHWYLGPQCTGFFLPSRQHWLCGTMTNDGKTAITGPAALGIAAPHDATAGELFVGEMLCVALSLRGSQPPPAAGRVCFNAYWDTTGQWRYLGNGPAFQLRMDGNTGTLNFHWAPTGLADQPIASWSPGPSPPLIAFGPNAVSLGTPPPADAAGSSFFANYICVPWSVGLGGANAARINFNCYFDTTMALRYAASGPAYRMVFPSTGTMGMHLRSAPTGTPDTVAPTFTDFFAALTADQLATGQTNVMLTTNETGTLTFQQVLVGPAGSGPGGSGRALYVAT